MKHRCFEYLHIRKRPQKGELLITQTLKARALACLHHYDTIALLTLSCTWKINKGSHGNYYVVLNSRKYKQSQI
jgi:hypothetical protein